MYNSRAFCTGVNSVFGAGARASKNNPLLKGCQLIGGQTRGTYHVQLVGHAWRYVNPHATAEFLFLLDRLLQDATRQVAEEQLLRMPYASCMSDADFEWVSHVLAEKGMLAPERQGAEAVQVLKEAHAGRERRAREIHDAALQEKFSKTRTYTFPLQKSEVEKGVNLGRDTHSVTLNKYLDLVLHETNVGKGGKARKAHQSDKADEVGCSGSGEDAGGEEEGAGVAHASQPEAQPQSHFQALDPMGRFLDDFCAAGEGMQTGSHHATSGTEGECEGLQQRLLSALQRHQFGTAEENDEFQGACAAVNQFNEMYQLGDFPCAWGKLIDALNCKQSPQSFLPAVQACEKYFKLPEDGDRQQQQQQQEREQQEQQQQQQQQALQEHLQQQAQQQAQQQQTQQQQSRPEQMMQELFDDDDVFGLNPIFAETFGFAPPQPRAPISNSREQPQGAATRPSVSHAPMPGLAVEGSSRAQPSAQQGGAAPQRAQPQRSQPSQGAATRPSVSHAPMPGLAVEGSGRAQPSAQQGGAAPQRAQPTQACSDAGGPSSSHAPAADVAVEGGAVPPREHIIQEKRRRAQQFREAALQQHERCEHLTAEAQPAKRGKGRPRKIPEAAEAEQNAKELEGGASQLDREADIEERKGREEGGQPSGKQRWCPTQRAVDRDNYGEAEGDRGGESSSASESIMEDDDEEARVTKKSRIQALRASVDDALERGYEEKQRKLYGEAVAGDAQKLLGKNRLQKLHAALRPKNQSVQ